MSTWYLDVNPMNIACDVSGRPMNIACDVSGRPMNIACDVSGRHERMYFECVHVVCCDIYVLDVS